MKSLKVITLARRRVINGKMVGSVSQTVAQELPENVQVELTTYKAHGGLRSINSRFGEFTEILLDLPVSEV